MRIETPTFRLNFRAMATEFAITLWGGRDEIYLQSVAEEAAAEVRRLEQQLSLYREDSDVRDLNVNAWRRPISVDPRLFGLLVRAKELSDYSGGAFDITIAPLVRAWGFMGASGAPADPAAVEGAQQYVGIRLIELNESDLSVQFLREGVMIDLGAIGKGYAIEQAAGILRDHEVGGALIHGGTSSIEAIGTQADGSPWPIAIQDPTDDGEFLTVLKLQDQALSVSAVHGKYFSEGETKFGHVIDARTGRPTQNAILAAVVAPSATDADALSTALLVSGEPFLEKLCERSDTGALVVVRDEKDEPVMVTCSLPE